MSRPGGSRACRRMTVKKAITTETKFYIFYYILDVVFHILILMQGAGWIEGRGSEDGVISAGSLAIS